MEKLFQILKKELIFFGSYNRNRRRIYLLSFFLLLGFSHDSFCQKNTENKNSTTPVAVNSLSGSMEEDWKEIQEMLAKYGGDYIGVNNKVATSGMPDGPMSGNGHVGIVSACDKNWSRIYITTNAFWRGKKFYVKPLPIGGSMLS